MKKHWIIVSLAVMLSASAWAATAEPKAARHVPTVDELLQLRVPRLAEISPDGRWVAYSVLTPDFKKDAFTPQVWLAETATGRTFQLTRGDDGAGNPKWSPDGRWLSFVSGRDGGKNQLFLISPDGGEAVRITDAKDGGGDYEWSADGRQIAFLAEEPEVPADKDRTEHLGDFRVVRSDYRHTHLWTIDVAKALETPAAGVQRTKGRDFSVGDFAWSPDGTRIAFSATVNPDLVQSASADIYLLKLADDTVTKIVDQPGPDTAPVWSPDGARIAFASAMGNPRYYALNSRLAMVPAAGGAPVSLTDAFDENPRLMSWKTEGIYFSALQRTAMHLFRVRPEDRRIDRVSQPDGLLAGAFSLTRDGRAVAFLAGAPDALPEVYVTEAEPFAPRRLTDFNAQTTGLILGTRELITWTSRDGESIEGVLIKPADFDPAKRYALLCVIHGGPTGIDRPVLLQPDSRYYPADIWAARGALVLKVNYRGSAGYGERFRTLNMRNLGVGDAWDVLSGVDHLVAQGWVDPKRVGCMGWSQGGYISAFLTTSSDRFAAISVGAGISNWATYYYNTDITPFTINYLGDDPVDDPEIYRLTSPMSYIREAKTPTLIQHGENDRRVPIPNAYELRQGLEDRGVPVEMVVYKGFGHGIGKPRASRAVMRHNLEWFGHHLWGDPKPDFTRPEVPKADKKEEK